jgi:glucan-binding YG repeat protein
MKNKILKYLLIVMFVEIIIFSGISEVKANAASNGWINIDNSWRYYSGPAITTGWSQNNGTWYYLDDNGMAKTGWIKSEGKWYYLDSCSGKMVTGWVEENGNWYYLNKSGEMKIGWLEENGSLYYLNNAGVMVKDCYIGSYYLGINGTCKKGPCHQRR